MKRKNTIEAYGIKGMRRLPWTKKFKNEVALEVWLEKNDAETYGIRWLENYEQ
jgi:hypothetical protein